MQSEVGVIIPTYNRAHLIGPTLASIVGQSCPPAEVVVVDDGSVDQTESVVRGFPSVKYIRIENSGQCRARNVGVAATTAPWIAFCDSDDLWHPDKLLLQTRLFAQAPDAQYGFTNFRFVMEDAWSDDSKFDTSPPGYWNLRRREMESGSFVVDEPLFERLLRHQPIFPSSIMMKRVFFEHIGGWKDALGRTLGEDLEFTLRCVTRPPIAVISQPVVGIRKHAANFSVDQFRGLSGEAQILQYVLENHPAAQDYAEAIREQILMRRISAAELAFLAGDVGKVRELLGQVPFRKRSWKLHLKSMVARCPGTGGRILRKGLMVLAANAAPGKTLCN
jgi:glycosyltransferase involved in cell wall biosynthesis